MNPKFIQKAVLRNKILKPFKGIDSCEVSKASVEIMLERFSNDNEIDFPFSR